MTNSWFTRAALPLTLLALLSYTAVNAQSGARGSGSVVVPAAPAQGGSGTVLPQPAGSATTSAPPTATYSAPTQPAQGSASVVAPGSSSVAAPPIVQGSGSTAPVVVQGSGVTTAPSSIVQGSGSTVVPQGSGATAVSPGTATFFQDPSFTPGTQVYQTYGCCSNSGFYQTAPRRVWRPFFRSSFRGSCQGF